MTDAPDIDPHRYEVHHFSGRGFRQAYVRVNPGGVPLLCVHGWPETKRIWWRVIEPLAAAGFDVIVPDLRDCGHFVPWEAPHALISATRVFCRDLLG